MKPKTLKQQVLDTLATWPGQTASSLQTSLKPRPSWLQLDTALHELEEEGRVRAACITVDGKQLTPPLYSLAAQAAEAPKRAEA